MIKRDWSRLRRWAGLLGALGLLSFVGAVATHGPAPRPVRSPVFLSRASGLAGQTGAANPQLFGDGGVSDPHLTTATSTSYNGDLRHLPPVPAGMEVVRPELEVESASASRAKIEDNVLQAPAGPSRPSQVMPGLLQNFAGLDFVNNGGYYPPDTNGDVGPNHYIQVVNASIGIFSKTGTPLVAETLNTFFQNAPAPCGGQAPTNFGDPVVLYDAQYDRWVVTDFSWTNIDTGPHYECIAASKTGDPVSGGWWYYAFPTDKSDPTHPRLNDYPKLGVWPDGIYMSANLFACSNNCGGSSSFTGVRAWAISSTQLYNGTVLTAVVFDRAAPISTLLPSNYRGAAPPPGRPNYFVSNDLNLTTLDVFKFQVDWTHPLSSTFTGPTQVSEVGYTAPPATVPEHNGNGLDTLSDRLMMQNQYRVISGTESLWLAHTADDPTGVRWYQVDVTGGAVAATPFQQGTYGLADGLNRWMPSLAVDKFGNMAVGYSASSAAQFPSIRYAGRLISDTLGTLGQSEAILIAGGGAQTVSCGNNPCVRWGDYSAMTVDPTDDCTFWYTTEYYSASDGNWQTRIASFRYPICGPAAPPVIPRAYLPLVSNSQPAGAWNTIMQESFEGAWPGASWQVSDSNGTYRWAQRSCHAATGSNSAWAIGGGSLGQGLQCGVNYPNNAYSWMVYGPVSLADATGAEFDAKLWLNTEPTYDVACLMASINGSLFDTSTKGTCLSGDSGGNFIPTSLDLSQVLNLGSLLGQPQVWVAVVFQSDDSVNYPDGAYADDLLLRKCVGGACPSGAFPALSSAVHAQTAALKRP